MRYTPDDAPFRAIVQNGLDDNESPIEPLAPESGSGDWSPDDLEAAYLRALEAADFTDQQLTAEIEGALQKSDEAGSQAAPTIATVEPEVVAPAPDDLTATFSNVQTARQDGLVTPLQVLEALLFVGGEPLTGKRLADLVGGGFDPAQVDGLIEQLNELYRDEARPYEVRLAAGGYRLELAPEFETVRNRVYGLGPKEVKLSQDALEVLAFIAYQQPADKEAIEATGKTNVGPLLRQLLRRELISLEKQDEDNSVRYRTTGRFLELFGLSEIEDLPQPDDLMFK